MSEWQELGNAIVLQAVKDYKAAQRVLKKKPGSKSAKAMIRNCERFFHGGWCEMLTDIDPDYLLRDSQGKVNAV